MTQFSPPPPHHYFRLRKPSLSQQSSPCSLPSRSRSAHLFSLSPPKPGHGKNRATHRWTVHCGVVSSIKRPWSFIKCSIGTSSSDAFLLIRRCSIKFRVERTSCLVIVVKTNATVTLQWHNKNKGL